MRDRSRIILQRSLLLLVFSGWLASCSNNGPAVSARAWYTGFHALDAQIVLSLTCSTRLAEVQLLLQRQSEILSQFSSHSYDLSRVKFDAVDQGKETAIVEVTGTEIVVEDQQTVSTEIQKHWQFFREAGVWKWCGEVSAVVERSLLPSIPFGTIVVVVSLVAIAIVFFLLSRQRDYSPFYSKTENGVVRQIQEYETGRIRWFSRVKGYGSISGDLGKTYSIDYGSFIDQAYHDLTNGERVLFQAEWTERGPRACNVIRIDNQPPSTNPHSRKLIILAERV